MRTWLRMALILLPGALIAMGCGQPAMQPVTQAPPVATSAPPMNSGQPQQGGGEVFQWQDVPVNQQVPISRAVFDQGGYQIFANTGETIVVPFVNQNLYAMKFGQTGGQPYFVNEGTAPVLYLPQGGFLENASAQGARWYPFSQGYAYRQPVYVGLAPTWSDYVGMGWYPGMHYYGGLWGISPYHPVWMPGFYINIGGSRYSSYNSYRTYYTTHRNYVQPRTVFNNYGTRSTGSFGTGRTSSGFGNRTGSTGSFGSGRSTGFGGRPSAGSTGSFGSGRSTGFGGGTTGRSSFGGGSIGRSPVGGGSSFGGGTTGRSSFGGGTPVGGGATGRSSFGGGSSGFSNTPRASGGSFGGGRSSSGSSFGGGRSSGSSSFGGGRSSGSSFGGGRSSGSSFGGGQSSGSSLGGRRR